MDSICTVKTTVFKIENHNARLYKHKQIRFKPVSGPVEQVHYFRGGAGVPGSTSGTD